MTSPVLAVISMFWKDSCGYIRMSALNLELLMLFSFLAVFHKNILTAAGRQPGLTANFAMSSTFSASFERSRRLRSGDVTLLLPLCNLFYANRYADFSTAPGAPLKQPNTCWKLIVFHILHSLFHRGFPQSTAPVYMHSRFT